MERGEAERRQNIRNDFNDNTPVLQSQQNKTRAQPGLPSEWGGGGGVPPGQNGLDSPLRCPSRASDADMSELNTTNQALGTGLITSNYNNDFFYDDEFSVQFDANLGEGECLPDVQMADDVDINAILQQLPDGVGAAGGCGVEHNVCFHGDMSTSDCLDTSQGESFSENDCISSAEMSELRHEPLFSPPPPEASDLQNLSTDSLGRNGSLDNSLLEQDFSYDWSNGVPSKDQYSIAFAGSVHKNSDTESVTSLGASGRGGLTSWARQSPDGSKKPYSQWDSNASSLEPRSGATSPEPPKSPEKPPRRPVTAWSAIKKEADHKCQSDKSLTTWRSLKETTGNPKESAGVRSRSLPELASKQAGDHRPHEDSESEEEDIMEDSVDSAEDRKPPKPERPSSENLYELFQRLRSGSDEDSDRMGSMSPSAMNQLMGAWSMSPAGSDQSINAVGAAAAAAADKRLSSWKTFNHLVPPTGEEVPGLDTIHEPKQFADALVGSGIITRSQIYGPPKKPPRVTNSSIQTSMTEGNISLEMFEKAQQTSIAAFDRELAKRAKHWLSVLEIPPKVILKYLAYQQQEQQKPFNKERLSNAVFYTNSKMPDMGFVKAHGLTHSQCMQLINQREQMAAPAATAQYTDTRDLRRRSRSYDSSSGYSSGSDPSSIGSDSATKKFMDIPTAPKRFDFVSSPEYERLMHMRRLRSPGAKPAQRPAQPRRDCRKCKRTTDIMSMSFPQYKGQVFARTPRDAVLFEMFEPREWYQMTMSANIPRIIQRLQSPGAVSPCHPWQKPLKSCLSKQQRVQRQMGLYQSGPFPAQHDMRVMKYSQEGQTRYQLMAPPHSRECVHGLSSKAGTAKSRGHQVDQSQPKHRASCSQTAPQIAPDLIPMMPCPCQGRPEVTRSSPPLPQQYPVVQSRAKKSVSFSEEISYLSPKPTPNTSPQKEKGDTSGRPRSNSLDSSPLPVPGQAKMFTFGTRAKTTEDMESSAESEPPTEFIVSPTTTEPPGSFIAAAAWGPKKELILGVVRGTEIVLAYFSKKLHQDVRSASTMACPEIGHLILTHVCPAVHAILQDGLRPYTRSLFGQVRNCVWALVEESCQQGPSMKALQTLLHDLTNLTFLDTNWLKFNAFIFGLLNHRALDFWLTYVQHQDRLLLKHYEEDALLAQSTGRYRHLFMAMTSALQPLTQIPFRLEYTFEFRRQQERHADFLLEKHVSAASETHQEGQLFLRQMHHQRKDQMYTSAPLEKVAHSPTSEAMPLVKPMTRSDVSDARPQLAMHEAPPTYQEAVCQGATGSNKDSLVMLDAINNTLPVSKLVPKPSARPLTPTRVPTLKGINDSSSSSDTTSITMVSAVPGKACADQEMLLQVTTTVSATPVPPPAVAVVKNNKILAPEYESQELPPEKGLVSRLAQQFSNSSVEDKVYKRGITEYEFDLEADGKGLTNLTKASYKNASMGNKGEVMESTGSWTQDSGIDELRSQELAEKGMPPLKVAPSWRDPTKRWSEGEATLLDSDGGVQQVKKRWSTFGPKIIKFFDNLLLDENPKQCSDSYLLQQCDNIKNEKQEVINKSLPMKAVHDLQKIPPVVPQKPIVVAHAKVQASRDTSPVKQISTTSKIPLSPTTKSKLPVSKAKDVSPKKPAQAVSGPVGVGRQSAPGRKLPTTPDAASESKRASRSQGIKSSQQPAARSPGSPMRESQSRIPTFTKKSKNAAADTVMKTSETQTDVPSERECELPSGVVCKQEIVNPVAQYVTVYPQKCVEEQVVKPPVSRAQYGSPARRDVSARRDSSVSARRDSSASRGANSSPARSTPSLTRKANQSPARTAASQPSPAPTRRASPLSKVQSKIDSSCPVSKLASSAAATPGKSQVRKPAGVKAPPKPERAENPAGNSVSSANTVKAVASKKLMSNVMNMKLKEKVPPRLPPRKLPVPVPTEKASRIPGSAAIKPAGKVPIKAK